jgi:hypothetical protein
VLAGYADGHVALVTPGDLWDLAQAILNDMTLPHEGYPHGVPANWNWAQGPEINMGNTPGAFTAMIAWGQLYEAREGNPARNTRVQLRDIRSCVLSKADGQWQQLQYVHRIEGAAYIEDFSGNANHPADVRNEQDGTISVTAGDGYNFHFWPSTITFTSRVTINPADIAAILTTCQARLIVGNPALPDDRATARYVMNMGGDYWIDLTAAWAPNYQHNDDIGMGRFKYVTADWQNFFMTTASAAQISATAAQLAVIPPPLQSP